LRKWLNKLTVRYSHCSIDFLLPNSTFPQILIIIGQTGESDSSNNLLLFDFDTELHAINDGMNIENNTRKREKKDVKLPLFSYKSILAATNNFSAVNKLGEGGFGPVYKVRYIFLMNVL
jgi:hypothetical protein